LKKYHYFDVLLLKHSTVLLDIRPLVKWQKVLWIGGIGLWSASVSNIGRYLK